MPPLGSPETRATRPPLSSPAARVFGPGRCHRLAHSTPASNCCRKRWQPTTQTTVSWLPRRIKQPWPPLPPCPRFNFFSLTHLVLQQQETTAASKQWRRRAAIEARGGGARHWRNTQTGEEVRGARRNSPAGRRGARRQGEEGSSLRRLGRRQAGRSCSGGLQLPKIDGGGAPVDLNGRWRLGPPLRSWGCRLKPEGVA